MDTKKRNKSSGKKDHNVAGVLCIIISSFFLICISTPLLSDIGTFIKNLTMGLIGYLSFPIILCTLFLGVLLLMNKKTVLSYKQITFIILIAIFAVFILQTALDSAKLSDNFGAYISSLISFNKDNTLADYSVGGVIFGIFVYGIKSIISIVGAYILYSILLILFCGLLIYDFRQAAQKKIIEDKAKKTPRYIPFEKGKNPPQPVRDVYDPTLFVGTIERTKKTVVQTGDFSSMQNNSVNNIPSSGTISHFDSAQNSDRIDEYNFRSRDMQDYNQDEYDENLHESAMKKLFGNPEEVYRNYEEQLRKNMNIREKSGRVSYLPNDDAVVLSKPQSVSLYPSIDREPNKKQTPDIKSILPEIAFLPEKDVSDQIVDGPILNGDEISKSIKDSQKQNIEQSEQDKNINAEVEEESEPELSPIIVGNPKPKKEERSIEPQDKPNDEPEIEQMPILNGDNFAEKEITKEQSPRQDFWSVRFGGIFKEQSNETAENEDGGSENDALTNYDAKPDDKSDDNDFALNIDDEALELDDEERSNEDLSFDENKDVDISDVIDEKSQVEESSDQAFNTENNNGDNYVESDDVSDADENNVHIDFETSDNEATDIEASDNDVDTTDNIIEQAGTENSDDLIANDVDQPDNLDESFDDEPFEVKIPDSLKMINESVDMSETSDEVDSDNTGYYTTEFEKNVGEISLKLNDDKFGLSKGTGVNNQINMDDYDVEIKNDKPKKIKKHIRYTPPPIDLLVTNSTESDDDEDYEQNARNLEEVLHNLKVDAKVVTITRGPAVTRYELEVALGQSVKSIPNRAEDIAYSLASNGSVRIEAPITGKRAVGVEVPNKSVAIVSLKDIIDSEEFTQSKSCLTMALGKDISGKNILCNLEKMPHLLIAGATGSGKSACLNSIIISFLYKASPDDVRLILIDPKQVEFVLYRNMPHLLMKNIINDSTQAINAFKWARTEMDRRYTLFAKYSVRNLSDFNDCSAVINGVEPKLPRIVIIVDELAELMISKNAKELEQNIMSMSQKARAAGMHLILATQRPSVDVLTGTIKANFTSRIAFAVKSQADSRTILDFAGAETLLGRGDMLYAPLGSKEQRVQGAFITTEEVESIVNFVRENNETDFDEEAENIIMKKPEEAVAVAAEDEKSNESIEDPLMKEVLKKVIETHQASASQIQRRFSVGYNRAARLIDQMEERGYIGPLDGSKPREVKITREKFIEIYGEDIS